MAETRKISIVISAEDDYSAKLRKFNEALSASGTAAGGLSNSTDKLTREFGKLGDISEHAYVGVKRLGGTLQTMVFAAAIGGVSALTEAFIDYLKQSDLAQEKIDSLSNSVISQATAWKLLPDPMKAVTKESVELFNAQLKVLQLTADREIPNIERKIKTLKNLRAEAVQNKGIWTEFGEIVGDNSLAIAIYDLEITELNKELKTQQGFLGVQEASIKGVGAALTTAAKEAKEALIAPSGTNFLTAFIAGDFAYAAKKIEFDGLALGETYVAAVKWGMEKKKAELGVGTFVFSMPGIPSVSPQVWFPPPPQMDAHVAAYNQMEELQNAFGAKSRGYYDELIAMHAKYADDVIDHELRKSDLQIYLAKNSFAYAANTMQNLFVATGKHHRAMFELGKGFAIAQTAIDTYQASMAAYKALSGIPIVGPALGATAAAAIVATGLARVREINSTQPGGGSISSGGTASPSYSGGSPEAYPIPQRLEDPRPTQNITLIVQSLDPSSVNWDKLMEDNIKPALERLSGEGNTFLNIKVVNS